MKIAVEGCMHGELDNVYSTLKYLEEVENTKVDLLICCGDFQAVRNKNDLDSVNVKAKYRNMNSFWKYYTGQVIAPVPTVFIGGNHEASNYLWELYYGGWAAPNIYFLGFAGVIKFGNIRIAGLSGIYKEYSYHKGHYERAPYNEKEIRSIYHVREYDVYKLMQIEEPIDIFISHDWPRGITKYGDWEKLISQKPFFKEEVIEGMLGSKAAAELLDKLRPPFWFSGHLHCKFSAIIQHGEGGTATKFLALDKCLPGRKFLQVIDIESECGPFELLYDEEWLAITRKCNSMFPLTRQPTLFRNQQLDSEGHREWVRNLLKERESSKPFDFTSSVPAYGHPLSSATDSSGHVRNPQTEAFLQLLELPYLLDSSPTWGSNDRTFDDDSEYSAAADDVDDEEDFEES
ncbi:lariat debranching enzyme isoform X1 [Nymphaea colorata]|uniref:lariat debranching enzyme isoform X1 n=2 Tax=Nymphaea colorata TaxID=210225 RepID=UPI00129D7A42|nr:lariat debranching enzyme isoform X1 [Nymphaea colorata]XP_049932280.1 lariat debranching enzyme isoform X1 [Nymphaea colorata]XP_049932281.1 lariat debranching enzyme isoform X1 [Nymphaea colorata]